MKMQQLAIGARFEFAGKVFVKTGPMTGSDEQGGQQIIPRYAVLKPLDLPPPERPATPGRKFDAQRVHKAFDSFYETALQLIDAADVERLQAARTQFLAALK